MNKKAGIRFNPEYYVDVNMDDMMLKVETPEGVTEYPLSGGGGQWTETKIYENPNPNEAQNEIAFQLTESLQGYAYFKCVWKETFEDINSHITITDVRDLGEGEACLTGGISLDNCRRVLIQSNGEMNTLNVYNSLTKTGTTDNTTNIILAVYGIKREV